MFLQTNNNKGLHARLIEFSINWFDKEDSFEELYTVLNANHGKMWMFILKELHQHDKSEITAMFKKSKLYISERICAVDGTTQRNLERYAILHMTAKLCSKAWHIKFNESAFRDLLYRCHLSSMSESSSMQLHVANLKNTIEKYKDKFDMCQCTGFDPDKFWGYHNEFCGNPCLWILEDKLEAIAKEVGISDLRMLHADLANQQFLVRDKTNHYVIQKNISGDRYMRFYGVYLQTPQLQIINTLPLGLRRIPKKSFLSPEAARTGSCLRGDKNEEDL